MKVRKLPYAQIKPPLDVEVRASHAPLWVWYDEAREIKPDSWGVLWGEKVLTWELFSEAKELLN